MGGDVNLILFYLYELTHAMARLDGWMDAMAWMDRMGWDGLEV